MRTSRAARGPWSIPRPAIVRRGAPIPRGIPRSDACAAGVRPRRLRIGRLGVPKTLRRFSPERGKARVTPRGEKPSEDPAWQGNPLGGGAGAPLAYAPLAQPCWTGGRVVEGAGLENRWARKGLVSSNLTLSVRESGKEKAESVKGLFPFPFPLSAFLFGWVAEWFKAHAWKACGLQKGLVGSNPTPSVHLSPMTASPPPLSPRAT